MAEKITASQQEIQEALALLKRVRDQREKQRARIKNDPELQKKIKERGLRKRIETKLKLRKADQAGIKVTPAEIDAELAKLKK